MRYSPPVEYLYLLLLVGGLVHTLEATGQQLCQESQLVMWVLRWVDTSQHHLSVSEPVSLLVVHMCTPAP